uniref:Uncharacterized protein n=1 Tax=Coccidioides posadasii RMSCC 3488 TaxID=454284 RepID=A0A0J6F4B3_COCPO|nr:hypothetical protein CPAG_00163 [Coccidioides posadasii RMSCC 3488]
MSPPPPVCFIKDGDSYVSCSAHSVLERVIFSNRPIKGLGSRISIVSVSSLFAYAIAPYCSSKGHILATLLDQLHTGAGDGVDIPVLATMDGYCPGSGLLRVEMMMDWEDETRMYPPVSGEDDSERARAAEEEENSSTNKANCPVFLSNELCSDLVSYSEG